MDRSRGASNEVAHAVWMVEAERVGEFSQRGCCPPMRHPRGDVTPWCRRSPNLIEVGRCAKVAGNDRDHSCWREAREGTGLGDLIPLTRLQKQALDSLDKCLAPREPSFARFAQWIAGRSTDTASPATDSASAF